MRRKLQILILILLGLIAGSFAAFLPKIATLSAGPAEISVEAHPWTWGRTVVDLPPLGTVEAETHPIPIRLLLTVRRVRVEELESYLENRTSTSQLSSTFKQAIRDAAPGMLIRITALGALGGAAVSGLLRLGRRRALIPMVAGLIAPGILASSVLLTFDTEAFREPTLTGSLSQAPKLLGPLERIPARFQKFRDQIDEVGTTAFSIFRFLSEYSPIPADAVRVLHISDLHLNPVGFDLAKNVASTFGVHAVVDSGDTTAEGTSAEAVFVEAAKDLGVPYLWVRGNHDSPQTQSAVAGLPNAKVLDGGTMDIEGISFAGFGDPTFTPGREPKFTTEAQQEEKRREAEEILETVQGFPERPDVVVVHDRLIAERLAGEVPLVLAGHGHRFSRTSRKGTLFLSVGSTGGAGLQSLSPQSQIPRSLHVLYFSPISRRLLAVDRIDVTGTVPRFSLSRIVFEQDEP